jgi:glycosyltransferase involved in cell wall biosynthesis
MAGPIGASLMHEAHVTRTDASGSLNVCFVCFAGYPDQGATYAYEMSRSVAGAGHRVTVIAVRRHGEPAEERRDGVLVKRFDAPLTMRWTSFERWRAKGAFFWRAARLIRSQGFDIVHVYCTIGAFILPAFARRGAKWIQEHQTGAVSAQSALVRACEDRLRALQGNFFDLNLTVSRKLGERLFGNRVAFDEMPAGVNLRLFRPGLPRDLRAERGIPNDGIVFVHAGVLEATRATDVPIRAFARALAKNDRLWLWMPGKGAQLDELRLLAEQLQVSRRVWLPGYVPYESLPHIFAAADAGLSYLPAVGYYEGQPPMKVMEYMGAGLPVIASDVGSHRVCIQNGENGLLASPDQESYAQAMLNFAADSDLRERLAATAVRSVAHLTYDCIATDRLIPVYRRLLSAS